LTFGVTFVNSLYVVSQLDDVACMDMLRMLKSTN